MKDKFLIINADDFGYNGEQNKAISELYGAGLITSTSVMAVANSGCLRLTRRSSSDNQFG